MATTHDEDFSVEVTVSYDQPDDAWAPPLTLTVGRDESLRTVHVAAGRHFGVASDVASHIARDGVAYDDTVTVGDVAGTAPRVALWLETSEG